MKMHYIKVLLIEDDEDDYIIVRDLLSELSALSNLSFDKFILKWVSDYESGLSAILSNVFDVCLLDYRLNERNGVELMHEATSLGSMTPIVFLTGHGNYDLDLEAMSKGAADCLTKGELSATILERSIRYSMDRQRKREELIKAKRVIQVLSECNHAVIHIKDEVELLHAICRIMVDVGGYRMAWVGYAGEDLERTVTPVAWYGYEIGYLETVNITWQDAESGKGPTGACIRTGLPSVIRSVDTQAEFAPWKEEASKRGYASAVGLPLFLHGQRLGALNIYSSETNAFDTEEIEFLVKLSSNLSYGIGALRLSKAQMQAEESLRKANLDLEIRVRERRLAEEALKESRQELTNIIDFLPDATFVIDREGTVIAWNRAMEEISGVAAAVMLGKGRYEYALPFYGKRKPLLIDQVLDLGNAVEANCSNLERKGGVLAANFHIPNLRGRETHLFGTASALYDSKGNIVGAIESIRDITERKQAEDALKRANVLLFTEKESSIDGILVVDENNAIVSSNQRLADMWGISRDVMEAKVDAPVLRLVLEKVKDEQTFLERVSWLYAHRNETSLEEIALKDGRTFERYSAPMHGIDQKYYGRVWYFRDITERKLMEEAVCQGRRKIQGHI